MPRGDLRLLRTTRRVSFQCQRDRPILERGKESQCPHNSTPVLSVAREGESARCRDVLIQRKTEEVISTNDGAPRNEKAKEGCWRAVNHCVHEEMKSAGTARRFVPALNYRDLPAGSAAVREE